MNFPKGTQRESSHVKSRYRGNTIIQTESSYTAQKTRTIYAFLVPILTKPLPDLGFWKSRQATVVFYFQGGVGSFDGVLYPVIMRAKYFD